MSEPAFRGLSRRLGVLIAFLVLVGLALILSGREAAYSGWGFRGFPSLLSVPFAVTGIFILNRFPRHGIGWVFLALGLASAVQGVLFEYMLYSLVLYPGELPGGLQVAWLLEWYWVSIIFLIALILLLFPSGRLPTPAWRRYIWGTVAAMALFAGVMAVTPGPMDSSFGGLDNPYGLEALRPIDELVFAASAMVMLVAFGPPVASLFRRFRQAKGIERQQYKWFVYAAFLNLVASIISGPTNQLWLQMVFIVAILLLPIALAFAVMRYRLFDIDIIIRRTLQYGLLSGMIVLLYYGGVILLQAGLGVFTGVGESPIVTVITTLFIAALFNPLRLRVQDFVDRRFYRSRYDAEKALERFAAAARDEVDMDRFAVELLGTVEETMQPESSSLWLREPQHENPLRRPKNDG